MMFLALITAVASVVVEGLVAGVVVEEVVVEGVIVVEVVVKEVVVALTGDVLSAFETLVFEAPVERFFDRRILL